MKNIKISFIILTLVCGCALNTHAQLPDYYFSIDKVFWTSQSFKNGNKNYKYRVLAIKPNEYYQLIVERYELGKSELSKGKLRNSYSINDIDFDDYGIIVIDEVNLKQWIAPEKVILEINNDRCFLLQLAPNKNDLVIKECNG